MKFNKISNPKKYINELAGLPPDIVDQIPDCNDDPRVVRAYELQEKLKREKRETVGLLANLQEYAPEPAYRSDSQADAEKLLSGGDLESLTGPSAATQRSLLIRRLRALEVAIPAAEVRTQQACVEVVRQSCQRIRPVAEKFEKETLRCFEQLLCALKKQAKFYSLLGRKGFSRQSRPHHWQLTNFEQICVFGGLGFSCLDFYIEDRKKHWKFDGQKEK